MSTRVSIITVCYNSANTIEHTIRSVLKQRKTGVKLEYIVVDGASNDGTIDIIKKFEDEITIFISEPDSGVYDAMNKGIRLASGDIIGFLNSDDLYSHGKVIDRIITIFEKYNCDSVYGDVVYVDRNNISKIIRCWKSCSYEEGLFRKGWHPPHPAFFVKREIYEKYGKFRLDFEIAADYELMLRFLEKYRITTYYIPEILVRMRIGGKSNKDLRNILRANYECYRAWKVNGLSPPLLLPFYKIIRKLPQLWRTCG